MELVVRFLDGVCVYSVQVQLVEPRSFSATYFNGRLIMIVAASLVTLLTFIVIPYRSQLTKELVKGVANQQIVVPDNSKADILIASPQDTDAKEKGETKFTSAEEAYQVGVAFYNSRNFKNSRAPFEAAIHMTKDDELRLKAYQDND